MGVAAGDVVEGIACVPADAVCEDAGDVVCDFWIVDACLYEGVANENIEIEVWGDAEG